MKYSIGIDFGTLSARGVLLSSVGKTAAECEYVYPHGVMYEEIGEARQDAEDYLNGLVKIVKQLLRSVDPEDVLCIGVDFTSCTIVPMREGQPLSFCPEYKCKDALVKLWKHHGAQSQSDRLNAFTSPEKLKRVGGRESCEAFFPKLAEWFETSPEVWKAADCFLEGGDFITEFMSGVHVRSAGITAYKSIWDEKTGYPSFEDMDRAIPGFGKEVGGKLSGPVVPVDIPVGRVCPKFAALSGLSEKTLVCPGRNDAHASIPSCGVCREGDALVILGTSACVLLVTKEEHPVPDINGYAFGTLVPGMWGYEIGQASFGDHFSWAVKQIVPERYYEQAKEKNIDIHAYLTSLCEKKEPGQTGLIALDWWNGSRAVCIDSDLSGTLIGMKLGTRAEDIYRALLEGTCYGIRSIFELLEKHGIRSERILLSGGIPMKNPFLCQILSDILARPVSVVNCRNSGAVGTAIYGFTTCGECRNLEEACARFGAKAEKTYIPDPAHVSVYDSLYGEYKTLTEYFHRENHVMKRLSALRKGKE